MADVFSKAKRSDVMSRIRSRGNRATELEFVRLLRRHRIIGWRRHLALTLPRIEDGIIKRRPRLPRVRPDFVFLRARVAVFIDGCFWHGCPEHGTKPRGNATFWQSKLADNRTRDLYVTWALRRKDWTVLRFWEHQLEDGDRVIDPLRRTLTQTKG